MSSDESVAESPTEKRRRILIVDDDPDAVSLLEYLLKMKDYDIRSAFDGAQALEVAAEFHPEVVVLDLVLPVMDGWEAAQKLRKEPWGRDVRIIALSGYGEPRHKQRAREAGCDYHITKPVSDFGAFLALFDAPVPPAK